MGGRARMSISRPATKTDVWFEKSNVIAEFKSCIDSLYDMLQLYDLEKQNKSSNRSQYSGKAQCTAEANFTPEELAEIRKHGEDIIAKYRNNPTGSLAEFVKKCQSSAKLDEHGISNDQI